MYDLVLGDLLDNFTFVTDRASTLPFVVGPSISPALVPFGEKWIFIYRTT